MRLILGDCLVELAKMEENSIHAIVTDPPAGIGFMGHEWDSSKGGRLEWVEWMQEVAWNCLQVLKPGGYAVVWALPRTSHWTAWAWEGAGFEVRDRIAHVFGSGFPKSLNIGKELPEWEGWGTALKPAVEDWWIFRKPLSEKTVAKNVMKWGTGALNIDACRVPGESVPVNKLEKWSGFGQEKKPEYVQEVNNKGRWPANLIHDGSEEVVSMFPAEAGGQGRASGPTLGHMGANGIYGKADGKNMGEPQFYGDSGSAARFFYTAKPSMAEKNSGVWIGETRKKGEGYRPNDDGTKGIQSRLHGATSKVGNSHPTVKPLALMEYLITLVSRSGAVVLDPFMGSGTTLVACKTLGREGIGIEREEEYYKIAQARVSNAADPLFSVK